LIAFAQFVASGGGACVALLLLRSSFFRIENKALAVAAATSSSLANSPSEEGREVSVCEKRKVRGNR